MSERPSTSPVNVVRVQTNGTISLVIDESGHESAVTLHRATYIERSWRYHCPVQKADASSPGQSTRSDDYRSTAPWLTVLRERCQGVVCIGFRAAYLSVAVHGWTVRYETPPVRSDVADIARNHSPVWVRYRNTLAGAQFFVKFFDRVYRNTVRHSHQRKFGMGCVHTLCPGCSPSGGFRPTPLTALAS